MTDTFIYWIAAAIIGALVGGIGGVVSRSKRSPFSILLTLPALAYLLCNALASVFALALMYIFNWKPQGISSSVNLEWLQVIVAGVGGVVLFHTTLIVGSKKLALGVELSQFLENVLSGITEEMERQDRQISVQKVQRIMMDVSFDKAHKSLSLYCLNLRGTSRKQQLELGRDIKTLKAQQMGNLEKTTLLGVALIQIVGEDLLVQAVKDLGDRIKI